MSIREAFISSLAIIGVIKSDCLRLMILTMSSLPWCNYLYIIMITGIQPILGMWFLT